MSRPTPVLTARLATAAALLVAAAAVAFAWPPPAGALAGVLPAIPAVTAHRVPEGASARLLTGASPAIVSGDRLSFLEANLAASYPASFGGLYLRAGGSAVVKVVGPSADLESAARAAFRRAGLGGVRFVPGRASLTELVSLKEALLADAPLRRSGLVGAGIDVEHSAVVATTANGAVARRLESRYGALVETSTVTASRLDASRTNDSAPYNGGDMIISPSGVLCSLGFGVYDTVTGATYSLTAGHCGSHSWYNEARTATTFPASKEVGETAAGDLLTSDVDAQLVADSSSCIVWGAKGVRYFLTGYSNAPQGAAVLTEGAVSGDQSATVETYDWSGTIAGENLSNVDFISAVPSAGDSGGPVLYPTAFGPLAAGTLVGTMIEASGTAYGIVQNVDAELFDLSAEVGDELLPNVSANGTSC